MEVSRGDSGKHYTIPSAFVMSENTPGIQLERVVRPPGGGRHSLPLQPAPAVPSRSPLLPFSTLYPSRVLRTEGAEKPESRDPGPQTPAPSWAQLRDLQHLAIVGPARSQGAGRSTCAEAELYVWGPTRLSGAGIHLWKGVRQEVTGGEQKSSTKRTGPRGHLAGFGAEVSRVLLRFCEVATASLWSVVPRGTHCPGMGRGGRPALVSLVLLAVEMGRGQGRERQSPNASLCLEPGISRLGKRSQNSDLKAPALDISIQ